MRRGEIFGTSPWSNKNRKIAISSSPLHCNFIMLRGERSALVAKRLTLVLYLLYKVSMSNGCGSGQYKNGCHLDFLCSSCGWPSCETCDQCSAGYYCPGNNNYYTCSAGSYSRIAWSSCSYCSPGTYSGSGWSSCSACPSGTYIGYSGVLLM
jgi:hypothetical protein